MFIGAVTGRAGKKAAQKGIQAAAPPGKPLFCGGEQPEGSAAAGKSLGKVGLTASHKAAPGSEAEPGGDSGSGNPSSGRFLGGPDRVQINDPFSVLQLIMA